MFRFRVSLKHFMLMITASALFVALACHQWRIATRPDVSHSIVLGFSENYLPAAPTSGDLFDAINQVVPNPTELELPLITEALSLGKVRVMPYGTKEIEIVAIGKSWQMEPASVELLAHAAARSIRQDALAAGIASNAVSEFKALGSVQFPKSILVQYDRTKP